VNPGNDFRSTGGLPMLNAPGCPVQPDNFMETLTWLLHQAAGLAPVIPLDAHLRPTRPGRTRRESRRTRWTPSDARSAASGGICSSGLMPVIFT
jgi:Ni,Fe-hydrogenase I small subunit